MCLSCTVIFGARSEAQLLTIFFFFLAITTESQAKTDANGNQPINHAERREVNAKKSLGVDVNRNAKTLCKQCGTLVNGQISCCAKGGSWQGSCVSQYESKESVDNNNIHTWAEGVEICKGEISPHLTRVNMNAPPSAACRSTWDLQAQLLTTFRHHHRKQSKDGCQHETVDGTRGNNRNEHAKEP